MRPELESFLMVHNMDKVLNKAKTPLLDDKEIKRVEIIILKYKSPEMEQDCVSRVIKYTQWPYKLNVFDNRGNGPNTSKIWNKLIKESTCDYILFMDSDAFVQDTIGMVNHERPIQGVCWLTEMMKIFQMRNDVAIVGPVCGNNSVSTMQSMAPRDMDPILIDGHLSGYCFLVPKYIYNEVGLFDEDFCFYGEESDWIEKIIENSKFKIAVAPRAHVTHGYEQQGSAAAQQAQKEGEMNMGDDASYSYLVWNEKKKQRLAAKNIPYDYKK